MERRQAPAVPSRSSALRSSLFVPPLRPPLALAFITAYLPDLFFLSRGRYERWQGGGGEIAEMCVAAAWLNCTVMSSWQRKQTTTFASPPCGGTRLPAIVKQTRGPGLDWSGQAERDFQSQITVRDIISNYLVFKTLNFKVICCLVSLFWMCIFPFPDSDFIVNYC